MRSLPLLRSFDTARPAGDTPAGASSPSARFTRATAVARNPLVVQFWLLGIDAARGDLRARGFSKHPCDLGSSMYVLDGFVLHSAGLWLEQSDGVLHYLRPRETFYQLPRRGPEEDGVDVEPTLRPVPGARVLQRFQGLAAVRTRFLAHEAWVASTRGSSYRSTLLAGKLPPKVRRLVPAWHAWLTSSNDEPSLTPY